MEVEIAGQILPSLSKYKPMTTWHVNKSHPVFQLKNWYLINSRLDGMDSSLNLSLF